jgi:sugar lactone lactonase YvrE
LSGEAADLSESVTARKVDERGKRTSYLRNHFGAIVMPEQPANLNWGDRDYRTLYITATTSVDRLEMKTRGYVTYLEN